MAKKKQALPPPKKKSNEPPVEEGLPLWMATFADMVTLLLCFFVLLLSFANQDITKFKTLMGSIKDAFGVQIERPDAPYAAFSPTKFDRPEIKLEQQEQATLAMVQQLKSLTETLDLTKSAKITTDDEGVIMRVPNDELFLPGTAELKPTAQQYFQAVLRILEDHNYNIVVRGHTDDTPASGALYPSNWELSSARAASALRALIEQGGVPPTRLKAVGYANSLPLVPNNTELNRAVNRRTEFFFHRPDTRSW